jgi:hypothetical protein
MDHSVELKLDSNDAYQPLSPSAARHEASQSKQDKEDVDDLQRFSYLPRPISYLAHALLILPPLPYRHSKARYAPYVASLFLFAIAIERTFRQIDLWTSR